jgi:predicted small secreted protein
MAGARRGLAALIVVAGVLVWAGCNTVGGSSIDDSQIVSALHLKKAANGYEVNGEPFCHVDALLNDVDEVNSASEKKGVDFVIASPNGEAGVLARPPFAPSCKRQVNEALKKLARKSKNSD